MHTARHRFRVPVPHALPVQPAQASLHATPFQSQRPPTSLPSQLPCPLRQPARAFVVRRNVMQSPYASVASAASASGFLLTSLSKMPRPTILPPPDISPPRHFRSRLASLGRSPWHASEAFYAADQFEASDLLPDGRGRVCCALHLPQVDFGGVRSRTSTNRPLYIQVDSFCAGASLAQNLDHPT